MDKLRAGNIAKTIKGCIVWPSAESARTHGLGERRVLTMLLDPEELILVIEIKSTNSLWRVPVKILCRLGVGWRPVSNSPQCWYYVCGRWTDWML